MLFHLMIVIVAMCLTFNQYQKKLLYSHAAQRSNKKIIFKKSKSYNVSGDSLILQKFSAVTKKYNFFCKDILRMEENKIRYFLSNHS